MFTISSHLGLTPYTALKNAQSVQTLPIKVVKLTENAITPKYAHGATEDAGMDLHCIEDVTIEPGATQAVRTGISIELPPGVEAQIRPRSGLALKHGVIVVNSPGTVDPGYRGEIKVILTTLFKPIHFQAGDRVAQIVFNRYQPIELVEVESLSESERGEGGFGSSGK